MSTPCTRSAPSASTAMVATIDESTPPDSPMTTSPKPFLRDVVARAEHQRLVDLALGLEQRAPPAATSDGAAGARRPGHVDDARAPSAGRLGARRDLDVGDEQRLDELGGPGEHVTVARRPRATRRRRPARPGRRRGSRRRSGSPASAARAASICSRSRDLAGVVRRAVEVDDQLGAAAADVGDRTVRRSRRPRRS